MEEELGTHWESSEESSHYLQLLLLIVKCKDMQDVHA